MDDDQSQNAPIPPEPVDSPEPATAAVEPDSAQLTDSTPVDVPPEPPESPISSPSNTPAEDQNPPINQPENGEPEEPISAPDEPEIPVDDQPVSAPTPATDESPISEPVQSIPVQVPPPASAQPLQAPTPVTQPNSSESIQFRSIQARGRTKIQTNREEKLDKLIQFAQKKQIIDNEEVQVLLHISSATATRYLEALVKQGRLVREGSPRHAKYKFIR
jgi:hypothetical protein